MIPLVRACVLSRRYEKGELFSICTTYITYADLTPRDYVNAIHFLPPRLTLFPLCIPQSRVSLRPFSGSPVSYLVPHPDKRYLFYIIPSLIVS